jgi:hypothetical protein
MKNNNKFNFNKKVLLKNWFILIFILLIFLNIVIRIPLTTGEQGVDSFLIHSLSQSIVIEKTALWVIHPLSLFGLYPMAYPSGIPYFLSILSSQINFNLENTILITSILIGVISVFTSYLFFKFIFKKNKLLVFISCFLFSLAPLFLSYSIWTISTRGAAFIFVPLVFFLTFKILNKSKYLKRDIFLLILVHIFSIMIHRSMFLLFIISFFGILIIPCRYLFKKFIFRIIKVKNEFFLTIIYLLSFVFLFLIYYFIFDYLKISFLSDFSLSRKINSSFLFEYSTNPFIILFNVFLLMLTKINLFVGLAFFGILELIRRLLMKKDEVNILYILILILLFSHLIFLRLYSLIVYFPIFIILITFGIYWVKNWISKKIRMKFLSIIFVILILLCSLFWSSMLMFKWTFLTRETDNLINDEANRQITDFLYKNTYGKILTNVNKISSKIRGISQLEIYPIGQYEFLSMKLATQDNIQEIDFSNFNRLSLSFAQSDIVNELRKENKKLLDQFNVKDYNIFYLPNDLNIFNYILLYNPMNNKFTIGNNGTREDKKIYSSDKFQIFDLDSLI